MNGKRKIQIGTHSIETWFDEDAGDGFKYYAELHGNPSLPCGEKFYITFFNNVGCDEIPDSTHLVISLTKSEFKRINFVILKKKMAVCELGITLRIDYLEWEMSESVGKFVYRFVDSIKKELGFDANPVKTEYGYFIECWSRKANVPDIFSWYSDMGHSLEKIYQRELVNPTVLATVKQKYGDGRLHWWIRYVVVPLIGSGTVAAVIAKYLLR